MVPFVHQNAICESPNVGANTRIWAFAHVLPAAVIGADPVHARNKRARLGRDSRNRQAHLPHCASRLRGVHLPPCAPVGTAVGRGGLNCNRRGFSLE